MNIKRTTISGNTVAGAGGGLFNDKGIVNISWSSISENTSLTGGAIYGNSGVVNITASLFADNDAGQASALEFPALATRCTSRTAVLRKTPTGPDRGVISEQDPTASLLVLNRRSTVTHGRRRHPRRFC